jgi:hypothetical protein
MARRRKKTKLYARDILDFRPGFDRVERVDGIAYLVDGEGIYAPVPVDGDVMDDAVKANLERLSDREAAFMFEVVRDSPFLSPEGRAERLRVLLPRVVCFVVKV